MSTLLKRHQHTLVLLVASLGLGLSVVAFRTVQDWEQHRPGRFRPGPAEAGKTYFVTKGRITPEDFERRVVGLVERIVPDHPEREEASDQ